MIRIPAAALLAALTLPAVSSAAVVTDSYTLTPTAGSAFEPGQNGALSISFDDSGLTAGNGIVFDGIGLTALSVSYPGFSATLADDATSGATATIVDGAPSFVDFPATVAGSSYTFAATIGGGVVQTFSIVTAAGADVLSGGFPAAVPEPASLALVGAGLLGLGLVRRRA